MKQIFRLEIMHALPNWPLVDFRKQFGIVAPLVCLRNRQIDPPLIIGEYPKESRFLLKRVGGISLSSMWMPLSRRSPRKILPRNQQRLIEKLENPDFERQTC